MYQVGLNIPSHNSSLQNNKEKKPFCNFISNNETINTSLINPFIQLRITYVKEHLTHVINTLSVPNVSNIVDAGDYIRQQNFFKV